jgi:hypothetical protein
MTNGIFWRYAAAIAQLPLSIVLAPGTGLYVFPINDNDPLNVSLSGRLRQCYPGEARG